MRIGRTLCVILHYGSEADTWNCVRSLAGERGIDIVVADNDPSQELAIPPQLPATVAVHRTGGAASFAVANNMAVRHARKDEHEFALILNNDTLVEAGALQRMQAALEPADVGAVGPCMPYASDPAKIWACGGVVDRRRIAIYGMDVVRGTEPYEVDYLPGAAMLCRLQVWDRVGGLPEKYFLGFEEAEFALRARAAGFRILVAPRARILHRVGMSSDKQPMYVYNDVRNRMRFGRFLFGRIAGFLRAAVNTLLDVRQWRFGYGVWVRALADELSCRPLDRAALQDVRRRYPA